MKNCLPIMKLIPIVVSSHNIEKQDVLSFGIKPGYPEFHLGEHLSEKNIFYLKVDCFFFLFTIKCNREIRIHKLYIQKQALIEIIEFAQSRIISKYYNPLYSRL